MAGGGPLPRDQLLRLYRQILKAAQRYPSIKRDTIVEDIMGEFRAHRNWTDPQLIQREVASAVRSLEQLQSYSGMESTATEWAVTLKGSCE